MNRAFFALTMFLSLWAFGNGMVHLSLTKEFAVYWMRMAAVRKMLSVSMMLHFTILLTYEKTIKKNRWLLLLIHISAFILVYIFSISSLMTSSQYTLINEGYGWVNLVVANIWLSLYDVYFFTYVVLSLLMVRKWKNNFQSILAIKQANFFFMSFFIAFLLGVVIDYSSFSFLREKLPDISSFLILIPVWSMYYSSRHYGTLEKKELYIADTTVTESDKKNIFINLSFVFYALAFFSFISEILPNSNLEGVFVQALTKNLVLIGLGIIIQLIQQIENLKRRENLTVLILALSIPITSLQYLDQGGMTIWSLSMIIILSAIIFSNMTLLVVSSIVAIITQTVLWGLRPEIVVSVDKYDYILRISMLVLGLLVGLYINKMYVDKTKENKKQVEFQTMIAEIYYNFLKLDQSNFDTKINGLLKDMGSFFNVDRTYLFMIDYADDTMTYSHEWCNTEIGQEVGTIESMPLDVFPWWLDQLNYNNLVYIENVDFMPKEAKAEQDQLIRQKVKSLVSVPIFVDEKVRAFIGIDSVLELKVWSEEIIAMLRIMANIISRGIIHIEADKAIENMAYFDSLTGLPNRYLFTDRIDQAIKTSHQKRNKIAVVFIDLDGFKSINDYIGHSGGDELLLQVAIRLTSVVRSADSVARFGGDEFMILINDVSQYEEISQVIDKIMKVFLEPFTISQQKFSITASSGLAIYPMDGLGPENLIKNADLAMYKSKVKGGNQYTLFTSEMKKELQLELDLSQDLSLALDRDELIICYQPQIELKTNTIVGLEAVLHWEHPTQGRIDPNVFIPLAEKTHLIHRIDEWAIRAACIQNKNWQDMNLPPIKIAINLSSAQMINPLIAKSIQEILKETGLDPKYLEVEITESAIISGKEYVSEILRELRDTGISIAIDDFGTKFSSLSKLKNLPINLIKIDKQFVQGIDKNDKDKAITLTTIKLAKNLNFQVLAEGVESLSQLDFLKTNACDYSQGLYHYKQKTAVEMEGILVNIAKNTEGQGSKLRTAMQSN